MSSITSSPTTSRTRTLAGLPPSGVTSSFSFPTTTDYNNGNNGGYQSGGSGGVNSTLYLFTFLTTLLLLLAVSCGIVIRSFVLRRRFHRRVEEAIAAGVLLPSQTGDIGMGPGGTISVFRRHIGEKPKMWEVWIDERSPSDNHAMTASEWSKIQPVAVTRISDAPPNPKVEQTVDTPAPPPPASAFNRLTGRLPFGRGRAAVPANATPASPEVPLPTLGYGSSPALGQQHSEPLQDKPPNNSNANNSVQVAVLIAMPDPSKPRYSPKSAVADSPIDEETSGIKGAQQLLFQARSTLPDVLFFQANNDRLKFQLTQPRNMNCPTFASE
ncbi:hypothetical protein BDV93DRAFT_518648 [Ceratobasidium sp. AG-I]|nr:hypothetical protein BDV93DRAFT_518648 [Ceratobasidium sp. AG-I]